MRWKHLEQLCVCVCVCVSIIRPSMGKRQSQWHVQSLCHFMSSWVWSNHRRPSPARYDQLFQEWQLLSLSLSLFLSVHLVTWKRDWDTFWNSQVNCERSRAVSRYPLDFPLSLFSFDHLFLTTPWPRLRLCPLTTLLLLLLKTELASHTWILSQSSHSLGLLLRSFVTCNNSTFAWTWNTDHDLTFYLW